MATLEELLTQIQKCENGQVKVVLFDMYNMFAWLIEWLKNIEESICKEV